MLIVVIVQAIMIVGVLLWLAKGRSGPGVSNSDLVRLVDGKFTDLQQVMEGRLVGQQNSFVTTLQAQNQLVMEQLKTTHQRLDQSLNDGSERMKSIGEELQGVRDSAGQLLEAGKEMNQLHAIFAAPGLRGSFGEMLLERLLGDVLPPQSYEFQHSFRSGRKVDAIIRIGDRFVPVDAKFPLDGFKRILEAETDQERSRRRREWLRAVRTHVDAVAGYILPDEGTFDFAVLYVPAENVYTECLSSSDGTSAELHEYALSKRVILASPNTLFAYLQSIVIGLRGLRVEREARNILDHLASLSSDFQLYRRDLDVLGTHLGRAHAKFDEVARKADRFGDRLDRTISDDHHEAEGLGAA